MRLLILVFLMALVYLQNSAAQGPPPKPVAVGNIGTIKDGKFVSERLKLSVVIPPGYSTISTAENDVLANAGADIIKQGNSTDRQIDEALERSIKLFAISEKPYGVPGNSALELVAARQAKGVTANMSLAANLMLLKGSPLKLKRSLGSLKLGSNVFAAAEIEGTVNEITFMQRMYVVMHNGYAIVCAATYLTDQQRLDLEKILATLSLTK